MGATDQTGAGEHRVVEIFQEKQNLDLPRVIRNMQASHWDRVMIWQVSAYDPIS